VSFNWDRVGSAGQSAPQAVEGSHVLPISRISHAVFSSPDVARQAEYYSEVMGLTIAPEPKGSDLGGPERAGGYFLRSWLNQQLPSTCVSNSTALRSNPSARSTREIEFAQLDAARYDAQRV
jgi:hypothetical protein